MARTSKPKRVGILTAGGDSPGLNAAIRGFGKTAIGHYGMELVGFRDGITGLVANHWVDLDSHALSGILTVGGTILGTSRDKVHRMVVDGETRDMIPTVVENYAALGLDALIMLGGGGTAKNAMRLVDAGLNVLPLPKTIDNDIARTDTSFGFATAMEIATLQDGALAKVNPIRASTRPTYEKIANAMCAEDFPAQPKGGDRICHFCPYMFPCDRRATD